MPLRFVTGRSRPWNLLVLFALLAPCASISAQEARPPAAPAGTGSTVWYEKIRIRGYAQVRYNRLFESNPDFVCEQCDRSWGRNGGISFRRARLIVFGQVHPRVYLYMQPDFASTVGTSNNVAQIRDWYMDVGLDADNELRVRLGQSKIPYSFENMQSSQNRLPLDRADATNSAHVNERDLGAFLYWAPKRIRTRLSGLVSDDLKGSGDYGVLAFGVFNGQGANRAEANDGLHMVARATYPMSVRGQIIEPSIAAYGGKYVVTSDLRTSGVKGHRDWQYRDERVLASINIAPKPFGLLAEYNIGRGPEYNPARDSIETRRLHGGFVTASYQIKRGKQVAFPFVRYQVYDGGKKHERDARSYRVNDLELGVEWQPSPNFEVVANWYTGDRRFEDRQRPDNRQTGRLMRLHFQYNY